MRLKVEHPPVDYSTHPGGTMTGRLYLYANPTQNLEAATKQYVDTSTQSLNANNITTGTLSVARFPAFSGDITKAAGSATINLNSIHASTNTYPKVTVNARGLVIGGSSLSASDIPGISWSKITTGKPTTLSGYGITDALPKTGGTINGHILFNGSITGSLQAVTKSYVDSAISAASGAGIFTGMIITKPYSTTPSGFLKCNGAEVSKTTYSALYAIIGDVFSNFEYLFGAGKPWKQQNYFNTTQSGNLTGWTTGPTLPTGLADTHAIVTRNRVYLLGGRISASTVTNSIYTSVINSDGTLSAWTNGGTLPGNVCRSQAVVTKNRVYLLGGDNSTYGGVNGTVYTAPINSDGSLGTWTTGPSLPGPLSFSQAIVTNTKVYLLGGYSSSNNTNGTATSAVYVANLNTDGTIGTWSTATSLPGTLGRSQAIVTKNRVYLLGGTNSPSVINWVSTVYTAPIQSDGTLGTWQVGTSLPIALGDSQAVITKNTVYLISGNDSAVTTIYTAPVNTDGTIGSWSASGNLPVGMGASQVITTNSRIYMIGGYSGYNGIYINSVYGAPFSGGLNDYSPYYDGSIHTTTSGYFNLPDYTTQDLASGIYHYVKY